MRLATAVLLLVPPASWAGEIDELQRCKLGDAEACRAAAKRAGDRGDVTLADTLRARATELVGTEAPADDSTASGGERPLVEAAADVPALEALSPPPIVEAFEGPRSQPSRSSIPEVVDEAWEEESAPEKPRAAFSTSRFGVLGLLAGEGLVPLSTGVSALRWRVGGGARLSLLPRAGREGEVLPTVGLLVGAVGDGLGAGFFSELRFEMLVTSTESIAQARFTLYALSGLQTHGRVEPYVGIGVGWNWWPSGGGGGGGSLLPAIGGQGSLAGALLVLAAAVFIVPVIFAGRLELRYFPSANGVATGPRSTLEAPSAIALMVGVGA